ncbi:hypothetical protein [Parapedobacter pyrenivorans]|uniref:hypothetical protein n=1 Tax=Parapedobacter pyrenivorans TaxID=1305674 RepID=UPI0033422B4D
MLKQIKKGRALLIVFLPCLLVFASCFQIVEDVTVRKDGSGDAVFTANLSQSKTKLASIMLLDSVNGYKVPSRADIRNQLMKLEEELKEIEGIFNVTHSVDFDKFIATIRFSFTDVDKLNRISNNIFEEMKISPANKSSYAYRNDTRTFSRIYMHEPKAKLEFDKMKEADKEIFKSATYTSIYRFDRQVISQSNTSAKLASSKKAVMLQGSVLDLINGKNNITNHIKLAN